MTTAKVAFDYIADQPDELTLKVGEIITKIVEQDGGWWEGEVNGKRGMFPENFVERIQEEKPPTSQNAPSKAASIPTYKKKARVTFQYAPEQPDELALEVGDLIDVLEDDEQGWWRGRLGDKEGMFPSNFVEEIKEELTEKPPPIHPEPNQPVPTPPVDQPDSRANGGGGEIKKDRPKSQMGFGITMGDLSTHKLKKTTKSTDPPKNTYPPELPKGDATEKKLPQLPTPSPALAPTAHQPFSTPPAPKTMVTKSVQKARATFAYEPEQQDELKLAVGDVIVINNKEVFEGWMEGELNGKKGLFPDNFVELLPLETINVDSILPENAPKDIQQQKSVKRAAKENPPASPQQERAQPPPLAKPAKPMGALFPAGSNPLKQELEKKLAGGGRPPPPSSQKPKLNKPAPPGPPAKPTKPKVAAPPPLAKKFSAPVPPAAKSPPPLASNTNMNNSETVMQRTSSVSSKDKAPAIPNELPTRTQSASFKRPTENANNEVDLDVVKSSDPLKHMQRAKAPAKNPPSKFKGAGGRERVEKEEPEANDGTDGPLAAATTITATATATAADLQEVTELKSQVNELVEKLFEFEKKSKLLFKQLQEELDTEKRNRMSQQVEIDRMKRQIEYLEEH